MMENIKHPDPMDSAAAETDAQIEAALAQQRLRSQVASRRWPPRLDGDCACGCGNEVDPRRHSLGYGLTLECAEKLERRA